MNILITGAAGFVGFELANRLSDKANVYRLYHDHHRRSDGGIEGDVTDFNRMQEIIVNCEIDQIYHLAGKSLLGNCRVDPLGTFDTNVMGTVCVLEAARQSQRVKGILVAESYTSYGRGPVPYREDQPLMPEGIYEASKAAVSHIMSAYHKTYGLPVFSVRCCHTYGPGDHNLSRLIPTTIIRVLQGNPCRIIDGAGDCLREFVYIDDVCWCMEHLMEIGPWGEVVNVGSGEVHTIRNIIEMVHELMSVAAPIEQHESSDSYPGIPEQWLCLAKLRRLLPDFTPTPLKEGLRKTIDWYRPEHTP